MRVFVCCGRVVLFSRFTTLVTTRWRGTASRLDRVQPPRDLFDVSVPLNGHCQSSDQHDGQRGCAHKRLKVVVVGVARAHVEPRHEHERLQH